MRAKLGPGLPLRFIRDDSFFCEVAVVGDVDFLGFVHERYWEILGVTLLFPVCAVVVGMQRLKTHGWPFANDDCATGLRQAYRVFSGRTFELFPIEPGITEKIVPSDALDFLQGFADFLELGCVHIKQFILKRRVIHVQ